MLPEDSIDIYKRNMVSRYIIIPSEEVFNTLCALCILYKEVPVASQKGGE